MRNQLSVIVICLVALSCTNNDLSVSQQQNGIIGLWSRETVYLNGINSIAYVDFLNGGTNFLNINKDKTFTRAYDNGTWSLSNLTLKLQRDSNSGMVDWSYKIVEQTKNSLTLEVKLTEGQYCCGFAQFSDNEIITIREVYKREN